MKGKQRKPRVEWVVVLGLTVGLVHAQPPPERVELRGRVLDGRTLKGIPKAKVILRPDEGTPSDLPPPSGKETETGDDGAFWLIRVEEGTYQLYVRGPVYRTSEYQVHQQRLNVRPGLAALEIVLQPLPRVHGRLLADDGTPLAEEPVNFHLRPVDGQSRPSGQSGQTDAEGRYELILPEAGRYGVIAVAGGRYGRVEQMDASQGEDLTGVDIQMVSLGEGLIPELKAYLSDKDVGLRYWAALALAELGDAACVPLLVEMGDPVPRACQRLGAAKLLPAALALCQTEEPQQLQSLQRFFDVLVWSGFLDERAVGPLQEALRHRDPRVVRQAIRLVVHGASRSVERPPGTQPLPAEPFRPLLRRLLAAEDAGVRVEAALAMVSLGWESSRPGLEAALESAEKDLARRAAFLLGELGDPAALPALRKAAQSHNRDLAFEAWIALGRIEEKARVPEQERQAVSALTRLAADPDGDVRARALEALHRLGVKSAQEVFIAALEDEEEGARCSAAMALFEWREEVGLKALARRLDDDSSAVRDWAGRALAEVGYDDALMETMPGHLQSQDPSVRFYAARYLARHGRKEAAPVLIELLGNEEIHGWEEAVSLLGTLGDLAAVRPLAALLSGQDWQLAAIAAEALGHLGPAAKEAVPALSELLTSRYKEQREAALHALVAIRDPAALLLLKKVLEAMEERLEPVEAARYVEAIIALGGKEEWPYLAKLLRSGKTSSGAAARQLAAMGQPGLEALREALREGTPVGRAIAAQELGEVKDPEVVTALTEALEDADARVRETTARALGKMGSEAAVAPLGRALQDAEADVRQAAARALAAIPTKDATDWLRKGLQDADGEVVLDCAEALEKRGEAVPVEPLIRALQEGEGRVRGRVAQALARRDEAPALAALRALYYEQPPTSEPHAFRLARLLRPLATCEDEEGNRWAAFQWHKLGNGGDLWLTRARGGGKWELPIFTGVSLKPWLPQVTLKVTADGRVVVHSGGGYGPPEGQFRPEQEWTWQLRDLQQDRDSDGLPDLEEARMFTNPKRADTDGDGVPDGRDGNPLAARSQIPTDLEQIRQAVFLHAFMLNSEGHWGEVVPLQIADGAPQEFNGYPGPVLCLTPEQAARWNEQSSEGHGAPTLGPVRIDAKRGEARVRFTYAPGRGGGLPGPNGCEFLLRKKRGVWVVMEQETVWE